MSKRRKNESIIDGRKRCFICGSQQMLQKHHALHGTANRQLAEKDGLWVWLCLRCHMDLHDHGTGDSTLKAHAQRCWMEHYHKTEEDFRKRYGKSFL